MQPTTDEFATARNRQDPFSMGQDSANDFGMQQTSDFGMQQVGGLDTFGEDGFGKKKDKKDKKHKKESFGMDDFNAPTIGGDNLDTFAADGLGGMDLSHSAFETQPSKINRHQSRERFDGDQEREISKACEHFSAVIEADRAVSRQLRSEVDKLEDEHQQLRNEHNHVSEEVRREKQQREQMTSEKQRLEQQLAEAKNRLDLLREHRRAVDLESISLRRDRDHVSGELLFLQKMTKEEEITLECLRHTNSDLERSYISIEGQNESLERERRHLVEQVAEERRLVQMGERQNAEIRTRVERLRRELGFEQQSRREEFEREKRREEMQTGMENPLFASRQLPSSARVTASGIAAHSWANTIAAEATSANGVGSSMVTITPSVQRPIVEGRSHATSSRQLLTTGPSSRQGV